MADIIERPHYDRFSALVTTTGYQTVRTYQMRDNAVWRLSIKMAARQMNGAHRASFERVALLYRQSGSSVTLQGSVPHTDETQKSHSNMDIQLVLGVNSFSIQVRNAAAVFTRWSAQVDLIQVT